MLVFLEGYSTVISSVLGAKSSLKGEKYIRSAIELFTNILGLGCINTKIIVSNPSCKRIRNIEKKMFAICLCI